MKIIYKSYMARPLKPFGEWDWEVREAVKTAIALVEGKNGFRTHSEIWRRCNLVITVGHNIYTTNRDTTTRAGRDTPQEQLA